MSLEISVDRLLSFKTTVENIYGLNLAPVQVENFLITKGFKKESVETNGWDVDFEITYKKDDLIITHTGNWYYGSSTLNIKRNKK